MPAPATGTKVYQPQHHVRIVTAASLFDGHDAAINLMRRLLQASGAEIIHLGHNRSVAEIVDCAVQEDAQAVAITSYQGGHVEFFKYIYDLLRTHHAGHIKIFGGGGGTILPHEVEELHAYGIDRLYSPDDGRTMGLQGMINDLLRRADFATPPPPGGRTLTDKLATGDPQTLARLITTAENDPDAFVTLRPALQEATQRGNRTTAVLGVTGTGGAGKSSLVDELVRRFLDDFDGGRADAPTVAILSVDPSRRRSGGALLGDRIRMNALHPPGAGPAHQPRPRAYMRSMATRQSNLALSRHVRDAIDVCRAAAFDLIIVETSGIGQSDTAVVDLCDVALYVMTADYGAATQLEKIDMLDYADVVAINKFDKRGSDDALRDVRKQYQRNRQAWDVPPERLPVFGTMAAQFNDPGTHRLYRCLMDALVEKSGAERLRSQFQATGPPPDKVLIIPPERTRYLAEIVENSRAYDRFVDEQTHLARQLYQLHGTMALLRAHDGPPAPAPADGSDGAGTTGEAARDVAGSDALRDLTDRYHHLEARLDPTCRALLHDWPAMQQRYRADQYTFRVRDRVIEQDLYTTSLSGTRLPRVVLPRYHDWGDVLRWLLTEHAPGFFPYTAGVFPLKRAGEDPTRMFAGEGGPERTNRRFHYLSAGTPAKRLSTAFDSVTLYGEDPDRRPDIWGKIGNAGVSVANLDDAKRLYSGFDLASPATSVSMTINGPAPMLLSFFLNAAIDQQCEVYIRAHGLTADVEQRISARYDAAGTPRPTYRGALPDGHDGLGLLLLGVTGNQVLDADTYGRIKDETLRAVRGTVQADILKEDQAQNTCIFSTEFALRMMGDVQQYFIDHQVRNFYSVSVSGYHIAEAGANPVSQLAFTLANGFTFVEYYLSRGMRIDDFAPNLSFFFSNGMDPEYAVLGRVARRIWAKAIRDKYHGNARSQKLKYHIQTSGRSLHAQEIAFNDIRTTLQALLAIYDNCNSLHTNAYDEAITTPTEASVRRAVAIQLIINQELGLARNENPLQGAFVIDALTHLVEEAVMQEFQRLSERGGVLGAMERMYQRGKIQEESMHYETLKHNGALPIVGVNTFLDPQGSPTRLPEAVIRATSDEKEAAVAGRDAFRTCHQEAARQALDNLKNAAVARGNLFAALMEAGKVCTLGQLSGALYAVGGQYRRNM